LVKPVDLRQGDRAGLDGRTQRRLFRGDVPIDRRLDLHGHTAARAQAKLQSFIEDAAYSGCRCVLVITGKGAGVLQSHVPDWLKRAPLSSLVLALAEARQTDGGSGAFYVLLRRQR
jgi:DNA-nicking Smr family endonuclease